MTPTASSAPRDARDLAAWFVRRTGPDWSADDETAFQRWLADDPLRQHDWQRWQADWVLMEHLPGDTADRLRAMVQADRAAAGRSPVGAVVSRVRPRRLAIASALAVASVTGMALVIGWQGLQDGRAQPVYQQTFDTLRGQQLQARLPDGSRLRLDTATRLAVRFHHDRREVRLLQGQAFFEVQPDTERPFHVLADAVRVTVVGTRFGVRLTPEVPGREGVEVAVEHGRVRLLATADSAGWAPLELGADQWAVFGPDGAAPSQRPLPPEGPAPWRQPLLSFNNVPLRQAIAEMERYTAQGIATVHPAAAGLRLSGTFDPRDPAATRRLLTAALPIRVDDGPQGHRLLLAR